MRIRVAPIGADDVVLEDMTSAYSAWYVYGLKLLREGNTTKLIWPEINEMVEVYRSSNLETWEWIASTDDTEFVDIEAVSQADKFFYRLKVVE